MIDWNVLAFLVLTPLVLLLLGLIAFWLARLEKPPASSPHDR